MEFFLTIIALGIGLGILMASWDREKEQEELNYLQKCIEEHFSTLWMKWKQTIYEDDYGQTRYDDWFKEVNYFISNVVFSEKKLEKINCFQEFHNYWDVLARNHLLKELKENESSIDIVVNNGLDYECYVEKYLQNLGYSVIRTPKTGDQGVDLIAEMNDERKAVQCKYYSRPVGNKAVQEVIAGANFYQCNSAIVISNASFTKSARQLAENSGVGLLNLIP